MKYMGGLWRVSFLWLCLFLLGSASIAVAQTPKNISERLTDLKQNFNELQKLWNEHKQQLDEALAQQKLLEKALADSQQELDQLTTSLQQSQESSTKLSESFKEYQQGSRCRLIRAWIVGPLAGLAGGILIGWLVL